LSKITLLKTVFKEHKAVIASKIYFQGGIFNTNQIYRYDHPHIMAGQGTVGLEILEDVPDADAIVVPVGGGGLLAGVSLAVKTLKKNCKIIVSTSNFIVLLNCTMRV
jgi:threonine dehydratase